MAWFQRAPAEARSGPALVVEALNVFYGRAHALQSASLSLHRGVLAVVGRNGMGKSTLCNAVAGLVPSTGSIRLYGKDIRGLNPNTVTSLGVGYVPQGRRVWPSLTVHEHLKLAATTARKGAWTIDRVYQTFPRLAERKQNGGAQLSGGEQQMLAIGRALLFNPSLLVMDEPTEGLAPVIVQQVAGMLREIAASGEIAILLIEQNLGVAMDVADDIAVMVNGQIAHKLTAQALAADRDLQTRLLGVRQSEDEEEVSDGEATVLHDATDGRTVQVFTVKRAGDVDAPSLDEERSVAGFNRWNAARNHAARYFLELWPRRMGSRQPCERIRTSRHREERQDL
jgi:ABC-type branched-subunit amino acid transport system ATPase component